MYLKYSWGKKTVTKKSLCADTGLYSKSSQQRQQRQEVFNS